MKKNLIKAFLSLGVLTLVAVSGMTLAQDPYVINIGNMDSYGVLNLGRLVMRNTGGITGIVLDGGFGSIDNYVIKIGEYAGRDDLSKLRVSNICDRKGNNCKRIADLNTGITIKGTTNGRICVKVSDQEINCDGTVVNKNETLARDSSKVIATVNGTDIKVGLPANPHKEGTITTNGASNPSIQYKEDGIVKGSVQIKGAGDTTVSASNGTITVTSTDKDTKGRIVVGKQTSTSNTNTSGPYLNYIDDRGSGDAIVNGIKFQGGGYTQVESNGNVITISSTPGPGNELHHEGSLVLANNNNPNNMTTSNSNTNLYYVENERVLNGVKLKGTNGVDVSAANGVLTIKNLLKSETKATNSSNTITNTASKQYAVVQDKDGYLSVNVPWTDQNTTYSASNGILLDNTTFKANLKSTTKATNSSNTITNTASRQYAVVQDKDGYLSVNVPRQGTTYSANNGILLDGTTFKANLKSYATSTNAAIDGGTDANRQYAVSLDKNGKLSVNVPRTNAGGNSFWKTDSSNRLTPKNGEDLYFEDGTRIKFGGKLYFQDTGIHLSYISAGTSCQGTVGVTQMDEKGLRVGTNTCNEVYGISTLGKISAGMVGSCSANTITMYATGGTATSSDHYEILGSNRLLVGTKGNSYIYFGNNGKVGINRTNLDSSYATVQIKGSLQISNCGTNTCNMNNVGQMRYFETGNTGYFVGCRKAGTSYERVVLSDSNTTKTPTTVNCSTVSVPYNTAEYDLVAPSVCR